MIVFITVILIGLITLYALAFGIAFIAGMLNGLIDEVKKRG